VGSRKDLMRGGRMKDGGLCEISMNCGVEVEVNRNAIEHDTGISETRGKQNDRSTLTERESVCGETCVPFCGVNPPPRIRLSPTYVEASKRPLNICCSSHF
jgi:hypothetical protein